MHNLKLTKYVTHLFHVIRTAGKCLGHNLLLHFIIFVFRKTVPFINKKSPQFLKEKVKQICENFKLLNSCSDLLSFYHLSL